MRGTLMRGTSVFEKFSHLPRIVSMGAVLNSKNNIQEYSGHRIFSSLNFFDLRTFRPAIFCLKNFCPGI